MENPPGCKMHPRIRCPYDTADSHQTPISFSACDMHENPSIFPEPQKFIPERWLTEDAEELARYKKFWWPFSKGSRNCAGLK